MQHHQDLFYRLNTRRDGIIGHFLSPFLTGLLKNMQKLILSSPNRRKRPASNAQNFEYFRVRVEEL